jgi:hypothetical protein
VAVFTVPFIHDIELVGLYDTVVQIEERLQIGRHVSFACIEALAMNFFDPNYLICSWPVSDDKKY